MARNRYSGATSGTLTVPTDLTAVAQALQQVRAKLQLRLGGAQDYSDVDAHYDDCAWVSNRWCELLPLPAATRQRLMSLDNPLLRLELVADFLAKAGIGTSAP